ncbi:MAG: DNA-binding transcriptional repressor DeoR [Candidatus Schmidhempelia sp.]|nr:DNA-binding transcriptional repressor DeoR [Candidatus Schmidhempelia sp.]
MAKRRDRLQKLVELLKSVETLHLKDAARLLAVSEMTLRRDINDSGTFPVNLLGGYLILASEQKQGIHYFISDQQQQHIEAKQHIGKLAARLIEENDTVFFDCGTTTPHIINHIDDYLRFTAICYSLNVCLALQKKKNCKVILCGGEFMETNAIFTSITPHSPLDALCPTKAFISAAGISMKAVTCFNLQEVNWKNQAIARSYRNILVADQSKFDVQQAAYIGTLSDFDVIISDNMPAIYHSYCQKKHISVLT